MLNPIYHLLSNHPNIQKGVSEKFNLKMSHHHFQVSGEPYYLLDLPVENNTMLTFNGKAMKVVSHHFTVPKNYDTNAAQYHYTINMTDNELNKYRVHIYYDKRDRINVKPILFIEKDDKECSLSNIMPQDMENLIDFSVNQNALIMKLKEYQNNLIELYLQLIRNAENELDVLREQFDTKKEAYIKLAQSHVENIKKLACLENTLYSQDRRFYEKDIALLTQSSQTSEKESSGAVKPLTESIDSTSEEGQKSLHESFDDSFAKEKEKVEETAMVNTEDLIKAYEKLSTDPAKQESFLNTWLDQFIDLHTKDKLSNKMQSHYFKLKRALKKMITSFLRNQDIYPHENLLVQSIALGIMPLTNPLLERILKMDKTSIIVKLYEKGIFTDSSLYALGKEGKKHTLLEWCVEFENVEAFATLMSLGFSLDYISMKDSPFLRLVTDDEINATFLLKKSLNMQIINRLVERLISILKHNVQDDPNSKEFYQAQLRYLLAIQKMRSLLSKVPELAKYFDAGVNNSIRINNETKLRVGVEKYQRYTKWKESHVGIVNKNAELIEMGFSLAECVPVENFPSGNQANHIDAVMDELIKHDNYDELEKHLMKSLQDIIDSINSLTMLFKLKNLVTPSRSYQSLKDLKNERKNLTAQFALLQFQNSPNGASETHQQTGNQAPNSARVKTKKKQTRK